MGSDSRAGPQGASDRDLGDGRLGGADAPQRRGGAMAQDRVLGDEHGREPDALPRHDPVADGVHAAVDPVQTARAQAAPDRVGAEAEGAKLAPGHHAMLASGQGGDRRIGPTHSTLCADIA